MAWWQWLVGILMFILALSVLIGIHELGHLGAAKMFHVYCFNYSIGFGPKLLSTKRSAKHETEWSLRAVPLGGFVAMYGEGVDMQGIDYIPPSRSLEGVARYKRAIIVSAGVFLNFILGFILIFCHNAFFDHVNFHLYSMAGVDGDKYASCFIVNVDEGLGNVKNGDGLKFFIDPLAKVSIGNNQTTSVFHLQTGITISSSSENYVLCFKNVITTTKVDPDISLSIGLYKQIPASEIIDSTISKGFTDSTFKSIYVVNNDIDTKDEAKMKEVDAHIKSLSKEAKDAEFKTEATKYYKGYYGDNAYSIDSSVAYNVAENTPDIHATLNFYDSNEEGKITSKETKDVSVTLKLNEKKNGFANTGIRMKRYITRYTFAQSLKVTGQEWLNANGAIFKALGQIFTGNVSNIGGIIAIASQSSQVLAGFGFERYLYMWGMISCNLAIINLLPIPGLDGWSLVVTAYEGITKKQIPTKVKGIVSLIGLVFVFALMVLIIIKDIIGLIA